MFRNTLLALTILLMGATADARGTEFQSALVSKTGSDTPSVCSSAVAGDICAADDVTTGDDLVVTGLATVGETLGVTGATTLSSTLAVTGATTLSGTLAVTGVTAKSFVVSDTFSEGASKGIYNLQSDGTAFDGTAGVLNIIHTSWGNTYAYFPIVGQTAEVVMSATGLNVAGDLTDNDGLEVYGGILGASGRPIVIGTDTAFSLCASITIADASGTDDLHVGFRGMEAPEAAVDDYTDVASFAIITNADPAAIYLATALNNAAMTETDTTQTWADGASKDLCVLVSGAGVVTYTNGGAAPTATAAFTFDDGDLVVPFIRLIQHGDLTEAVDITAWDIAYQ